MNTRKRSRGTKLFSSLITNSDLSLSSTNSTSTYHIPVMRDECMHYLNIKPDGLYLDCTLGGGGHTEAILQRGGRVIAIDQDLDAIATSTKRLQHYLDSRHLEIHRTNFRNMKNVLKQSNLAEQGQKALDGILMDLGISSWQIDCAARGFAFATNGPLDMRMSQDIALTAADIVNSYDVDDIANFLYHYGEERRSRVIARLIVQSRPIHTTEQLERVISSITSYKERTKTLARCFQALRIVINDEIPSLEEALSSSSAVLKRGGRLVVLSYHSLEDRRVKMLMKTGVITAAQGRERGPSLLLSSSTLSPSPVSPLLSPGNPWRLVEKRFVPPSQEEVGRNRRARSVKLRVAERVGEREGERGEGEGEREEGEGESVLTDREKRRSRRRGVREEGRGYEGEKQRRKREEEREESDPEEDQNSL